MMPQPPHHKEEQPRGLTDDTVDAAHDFMEHAEEDKEKVRFALLPPSHDETQGRNQDSDARGMQATHDKSSSLGQDKSVLEKAKEAAEETKETAEQKLRGFK